MPASTSARRIVAPTVARTVKPIVKPTVARIAGPTVEPIAGPIVALTVVLIVEPIAVLASDPRWVARPHVKAAARQGGRPMALRCLAAVLAVFAAQGVWAERGEVSAPQAGAPGEAKVFAAELEIGAGVESYRNPIAFIGEDATAIGLARKARRVSSPFREAALSVDMALPVAPGWAWTGASALEARRSSDLSALDHDRHTLTIGATRELDDDELGAELLFERLDVGSAFGRQAYGLRLDYVSRPDDAVAQGIALEWKRYRHDFPDDIEDGDRVSLTWARNSADDEGRGWRVKLAAAMLKNRWGYDDFSYRELAARAERVFVPAPDWTLSLGLAPRWTRYDDEAPDAGYRREDRRLTGVVGVGRALGEHASLQCEAELGRLYSNAPQARSRWNIAGCSLRLLF
ncbi:MAG: hypothetical protein J0M28_09535 [Thauera sp.]|nr:hypothetical protein [Thauera sp.]